MRIAITGGTGADVTVVSRRLGTPVDDVDKLTAAFDRVHVQGTAAVIEAARRAGVRTIVLLSFLRA